MAIANLGGLKTRVADYLARPVADIQTEFSAAVEMFEDEINADPDVRVAEMETEVTLAVSNGIAILPDDFIELRNVVGPNGDIRGSYYLSGLTLVFPSTDPNDAGISQVTILYYAKLPPLSADGDTNWLLLKYPHLYLYGVLEEMGIWLADASQIQVIGARKLQAIEKLKGADRNKRWGGVSVVISGPTP